MAGNLICLDINTGKVVDRNKVYRLSYISVIMYWF